jgi:hypothetical protein
MREIYKKIKARERERFVWLFGQRGSERKEKRKKEVNFLDLRGFNNLFFRFSHFLSPAHHSLLPEFSSAQFLFLLFFSVHFSSRRTTRRRLFTRRVTPNPPMETRRVGVSRQLEPPSRVDALFGLL